MDFFNLSMYKPINCNQSTEQFYDQKSPQTRSCSHSPLIPSPCPPLICSPL